MPAQPEEVVEALEEGVTLVDAAMLDAVIEQGGSGLALRCRRVRFEPGAQRGQFTVTPVDGSAFTLDADAVVPSIGQDPDLAPLHGVLAADGALLQVDAGQATSAARVYAGGDVTSLARFVTEAIGMGQRAAREIHRVLGGDGEPVPQRDAEAVVPLGAIATYYHPKHPRTAQARLDAVQRLAADVEVQLGLDVEQALAEAERCFSCGSCIRCDNCVVYCPDLAVRRLDDGYEVLTDYCKGCGLCVHECPTGAMKMVQEQR
jgi:Pyruvate/2-oxoacid:ferredoxin oxidoreductase delta subunit